MLSTLEGKMYNKKTIKNTNILVIDGDRGKNYPQQRDFSDDDYCLFLNAKNVTSDGFVFDQKMFISKEKDENLKKGKLSRYDLVLTTRGTVGNVAYYDDSVRFNNVRINSGMVILRCDPKEFDSEFLYYQLQSNYVQRQISQIKTGSAQPQLPIKLLNEICVIIPPLPIQKEVAKKIKTITHKRKNNLEEIQLLEQILLVNYNKTFSNNVQWVNSNVYNEVCETKIKNKENKDYPVLSVVKEGEFKASEDVFTKQVYSKSTKNYKIVRRNQVAYNPARANIGSIAMLKEYDVGLVSPIYTVFEMKDMITPTFFYYYMKQPIFQEMIKHHAIGTTRQNFPFEAFKMFPMVVPPMELQLKFEEIAKPIEQKIAKLKEENEVLAEIRDTLLPKLMSGELSVEAGEN